MKIAVIDIGSNSVRLMMWQDGKTLYKALATTRLGEGTSTSRTLLPSAIERTSQAVAEFYHRAKIEGAQKIGAFATEAVRSSTNASAFLNRVSELCPLNVDVLTSEDEAKFGAIGALDGESGVVIDVGGASSEVIFSQNGVITFSHSLPLGAVRLFDSYKRDYSALQNAINSAVKSVNYPRSNDLTVCAVGGTATMLAAAYHRLKEYNPDVVDGTVLSLESVKSFAELFLNSTVDEVMAMDGVEPRRADVIGGGTLLLYSILQAIGAKTVKISERDNMEGYVIGKIL